MDPRSLIGTTLDEKFEILALAGSGGMGSVYRAKQLGLEREVALKLLHVSLAHDEELRARFEREAHALSLLNHKSIGMFYSYGEWNDSPYIAMEFLVGTSLRQLLAEQGKIPWQRALRLMVQLCDAMQYAHEQGLIHRDLNPNNILIVNESGFDVLKIIDFGLAKVLAPTKSEIQKLTQTGELLGSVHYMSPELCAGIPVDLRSDIYSAACIFYECISGEAPFNAENPIGLLHKHVNETETPLSKKCKFPLPDGIDELISKAMAKTPEKRFQTMAELKHDITLILAGKGVDSAAFHELSKKNKTTGKKSNLKLIAGSLLGLTAIVSLSLALFSNSNEGLLLQANKILASKLEDEKLKKVEGILQHLEEHHASETKIKALRQAMVAALAGQKQGKQELRLCVKFAEQMQKENNTREADNWTWQGLRCFAAFSRGGALDSENQDLAAKLISIASQLRTRPNAAKLSICNNLTSTLYLLGDENETLTKLTIPALRLSCTQLSSEANKLDLLNIQKVLAINLLKTGSPEEGKKYLDLFIEGSNKLSIPAYQRFDPLCTFAEKFASRYGKIEEAKQFLAQSRKILPEISGQDSESYPLMLYARASFACGDTTEFARMTEHLHSIANALPVDVASLYTLTELISVEITRGKYNEARQDLEITKTIATKLGKNGTHIEQILRSYFDLMLDGGNITEAERFAQEEIQRSSVAHDRSALFDWSINLANAKLRGKDLNAYSSIIRKLVPKDSMEMEKLADLAMRYYEVIGDTSSAKSLYEKMRALVKEQSLDSEPYFENLCSRYFGILALNLKYEEQEKIAKEHLSDLENQKKPKANQITRWLWHAAAITRPESKRNEVRKSMEEILDKLNPSNTSSIGLVFYWTQFADHLYRTASVEEAEKAYEKALSFAATKEQRVLPTSALLLHEVLKPHRDMNRLNRLESSLKELMQTVLPPGVAAPAYSALASSAALKKQRKEMEAYSSKSAALRTAMSSSDKTMKCILVNDTIDNMKTLGDFAGYEAASEKLYELAKNLDRPLYQQRAAEELAFIGATKGKVKEALASLKKNIDELAPQFSSEELIRAKLRLLHLSAEFKDNETLRLTLDDIKNSKGPFPLVTIEDIARTLSRLKFKKEALELKELIGE